MWVKYFTSSKVVSQYRYTYGEPDVVEVRQTFNDILQAREWESKIIRRLNCVRDIRWLNKHDPRGLFYNDGSKAICEKISESLKGKLKSSEHRKNIWKNRSHQGRRLSHEEKEHLSKVLTGRIFSECHKQRISNSNKGKTRSDEFKLCRSTFMKNPENQPMNKLEARKKVSNALKGHTVSNETREIISVKIQNLSKVDCIHCGRSFSPAMFSRWHGEKCNLKIDK